MKNKRPLSFTAMSTYQVCPKKYEYHYIQKIRPKSQPSHFVFGSAVDKMLNEYLLTRDKDKALIELDKELNRLFTEKIDIVRKDYDDDLIIDSVREYITTSLRANGWKGDSLHILAKKLFDKIEHGEGISLNQKNALMLLIYETYKAKCVLILNSFISEVMPKFKEIKKVQYEVNRGIADFVAVTKDGKEWIVDNKTASRPYDKDAAEWSVQMIGYGAERAMYIVFCKSVRKNRVKTCVSCGNEAYSKHKTCQRPIGNVKICGGELDETISPEIIPQIVTAEISEHRRLMVEETYQQTEKLIETGIFPRDFSACKKQYGKPCPYINLCWNDDMTGLEKKEYKK